MDIDDNKILWSSATSDPGDEGTYKSAIYKIGSFQIENDEMKFILATPHFKQFVFESNKVEAMTIIKNKMVFATDDENLGAAINISVDGH